MSFIAKSPVFAFTVITFICMHSFTGIRTISDLDTILSAIWFAVGSFVLDIISGLLYYISLILLCLPNNALDVLDNFNFSSEDTPVMPSCVTEDTPVVPSCVTEDSTDKSSTDYAQGYMAYRIYALKAARRARALDLNRPQPSEPCLKYEEYHPEGDVHAALLAYIHKNFGNPEAASTNSKCKPVSNCVKASSKVIPVKDCRAVAVAQDDVEKSRPVPEPSVVLSSELDARDCPPSLASTHTSQLTEEIQAEKFVFVANPLEHGLYCSGSYNIHGNERDYSHRDCATQLWKDLSFHDDSELSTSFIIFD